MTDALTTERLGEMMDKLLGFRLTLIEALYNLPDDPRVDAFLEIVTPIMEMGSDIIDAAKVDVAALAAERDAALAAARRLPEVEGRLYDTLIAVCGGEDAPGAAMAVTPANVENIVGDMNALIRDAEARATAAEQRAEEAERVNAVWRQNSRETFEALCAMRNDINQHVPMPSLESDLLNGPDTSVFCAAVASSVIAGLAAEQQRVKALEEALAPFADEANMWGDLVPDDHAPVCVEMGHTDARYYGSAAKYTVGDLRRAAAIRARSTQEKSND